MDALKCTNGLCLRAFWLRRVRGQVTGGAWLECPARTSYPLLVHSTVGCTVYSHSFKNIYIQHSKTVVESRYLSCVNRAIFILIQVICLKWFNAAARMYEWSCLKHNIKGDKSELVKHCYIISYVFLFFLWLYFWVKDLLVVFLFRSWLCDSHDVLFVCDNFTHQVSPEIIPELLISYSVNDGA